MITTTVEKLHRQAKLVNLISQLTLLAYDDTKEYDSMLTRIEQRLNHYTTNKNKGE